VVFLTAFFLGLRLAAPGVTAGDSPELAAAALTFGVPHPPGYPLWTLLGKLFGFLPFGSPAFRVNLLSVVSLSGAAALLGRILARRWDDTKSGVFFGFGLALFACCGPLLLSQGLISEVYALHSLFVVALLGFVLFPAQQRFNASCFLIGLGAAHHHLLFLLLPAWICAYRTQASSLPRAIRGISLSLTGCALYLCLPLRAKADPFVNWSHTSDFLQFWSHLTRQQYGGNLASGSLVDGFWNLTFFVKSYFLEGWGVLSLLAVLGVWTRRDRLKEDGALLLGLLTLGVGLPALLRVHPNPENNEVISAFLPPLILWSTPCALEGLRWIWRWKLKTMVSLLGAAILLARFAIPWNVSDARRNLATEDMGRNFLQALPANSVLFSEGDTATFPLAYLQGVTGLRKDVKVFDRTGGLFENLYKLLDVRAKQKLNPLSMSKVEWDWESAHPGRLSFYTEKETASGRALEPFGLLFRPNDRVAVGPDLTRLWPAQREPRSQPRHDYLSRETAARFYVFRAVAGLRSNRDPDRVRQDFEKAAQLAWDNCRMLNNVGYEMLVAGWTDHASGYFKQAIQMDASFHLGWYNLGVLSRKNGRVAEAETNYKKTLELRPDYSPGRDALAGIYFQTNRQMQAVEEWTRLIQMNPDYVPAYHNLGFALLQVDPPQGKALLQKYMSFNPNPPDRDAILRAILSP
jgi:tetratricopeptide (TPR) repeat protein